MTQEEKDEILKKIARLSSTTAKGRSDYISGRRDALSKLRIFVKKMRVTEVYEWKKRIII